MASWQSVINKCATRSYFSVRVHQKFFTDLRALHAITDDKNRNALLKYEIVTRFRRNTIPQNNSAKTLYCACSETRFRVQLHLFGGPTYHTNGCIRLANESNTNSRDVWHLLWTFKQVLSTGFKKLTDRIITVIIWLPNDCRQFHTS